MNNIQQFLFKQVRKFCSEADDSMFPVELHKSYEEVVNFILSETNKEISTFWKQGAIIRLEDISTILNNLRVK